MVADLWRGKCSKCGGEVLGYKCDVPKEGERVLCLRCLLFGAPKRKKERKDD